ncbi:hypothetical protein RO3G_04932 [Rhizopus delemar RA 99-880]|uniref:Uncharacterized protein n=1 Tax=Rhizopus delemar (strain RA 99-880 / ATCC MYA-4621 / FGSC 9543 / NRRL 43880) TaxID=246409 RepID=I1BVJ7_RHIO9|nr:hypothetical protein RO3G_04932 [Rhizopus delemar RA 99-880]|eukprot:EIE80227.1 hypothetical protein RO3G_04932 [Rhizopus delemar RA 99-880]
MLELINQRKETYYWNVVLTAVTGLMSVLIKGYISFVSCYGVRLEFVRFLWC